VLIYCYRLMIIIIVAVLILYYVFRERRKEKEREDLWKKLDQLQLTALNNATNSAVKGKKR